MSSIAEQITAGIKEGFQGIRASLGGSSAEKITQLENAATVSAEKITALEGQLATANSKITQLEGAIVAKDQEIATMKGDHTKALAAKEADVDRRAGLKASQIAGSRGLDKPLQEEEGKKREGETPENAGGAGKSKIEQFNALVAEGKTKEAADFYNANKTELLG